MRDCPLYNRLKSLGVSTDYRTGYWVRLRIRTFRNDSWLGHKIEAQIKGTRHIGRYILADGSTISFPLEVKTINYGLSRPCPFLLIVVDVEMGRAYFLELQEYFIAHPNLFAKTEKEDGTINLHIDCSNVISEDDSGLQEIARRSYIGGATPELRLAR